MNYFTELKGNWNDTKANLKHKFAILTDNDLWYEEGKRYKMLDRLQIKLGKTDEEMKQIIYEL